MVKAVRGAIKIDEDKRDVIDRAILELISVLTGKNKIHEKGIVSIIFSQTKDILSRNPAAALRKTGYKYIPLFCTQEPEYENEMKQVIRILITYNCENDNETFPVYLNGAEKLRPDLNDK